MTNSVMLDTANAPLEIGVMYCCVTVVEGHTNYEELVRYCGKDAKSGQPQFADADTWEQCFPRCDGFLRQLGEAVDPVTQGWPALSN